MEGVDVHHDWDRTLVRDGCKPLYNALLRTRTREIPRYQTQPPLTPRLLRTLQLLHHLLDILRRRPRNDGVILKPRILKLLPYGREHFESLLVGEMDCFSCGPEHDEATDPGFREVDGVCGLGCEVERGGGGAVVCGGFGDEEGWDGDVDACGRWACHVVE